LSIEKYMKEYNWSLLDDDEVPVARLEAFRRAPKVIQIGDFRALKPSSQIGSFFIYFISIPKFKRLISIPNQR
jgi:hypothetical protein